MKYYLIAGEASGDLHASNLMQGIMDADPNAEFRFFGGDLMAAKGGVLVKHYRSMAFMGFVEVVRNIRSIFSNINLCKSDIAAHKPDVVILIDYPGFNMRIAKYAKEAGYRVFYYIAPKVWAWNERRVKKIRNYVDQLFVIFPFEVDFFRKHGIEPIYEGNPILDAIDLHQQELEGSDGLQPNLKSEGPVVTLMAGSREHEIKHNLPVMLSLVRQLPSYQFVVAGAPSITPDVYHSYIGNHDVKLIYGQTYSLLKHSTLAVVTSGTATLEAAILDVPEVVCYRGSTITMLIGWLVVRVKYISLVNLCLSREVVKELIQFDLTPARLLDEVRTLLPGEPNRQRMLNDFNSLREMLGNPGASFRVGKKIVDLVKQ